MKRRRVERTVGEREIDAGARPGRAAARHRRRRVVLPLKSTPRRGQRADRLLHQTRRNDAWESKRFFTSAVAGRKRSRTPAQRRAVCGGASGCRPVERRASHSLPGRNASYERERQRVDGGRSTFPPTSVEQAGGTFGENGEFKGLVYTITGIPGIDALKVTVGGQTLPTLPGGHLELDQPLHRSDF